MSYDVWLTIDTGGPNPALVAEIGNCTSNVSPMWADALGRSLGQYDGAIAAYALPDLRAAVACMEDDPAHYRAMDPVNGWGDYEGALDYLRRLVVACAANPKATIRISR